MDAGVHLPLIDFFDDGLTLERMTNTVDAARECGFAAVSANDHFLYPAPWLDGPTALAAMVQRSGTMTLMTSLALANLRGPIPLAKALTALDVLSGGRVVAGVGPGSSRADYEAVGTPFEDRWHRFDEVVAQLRVMVQPSDGRHGADADTAPLHLMPRPVQEDGIPLWIGSWGSASGLRRVARLGDGWLASAYNSTPETFAQHLSALRDPLETHGHASDGFPHALVTMWTRVTDTRTEAEAVVSEILSPLLRRDAAELRGRVCVGPAEECAELLSRYAAAGCQQVHFWPVGDECRQVERIAGDVLPLVRA